MSKIGDLVTGAVASGIINAAGGSFNALFMKGRSIGGIIPDVTIEETHSDQLVVTKHPVEQGAEITDHAYKQGAEVTMMIGWSNSSLLLSSIVTGSLFSGTINDVNDLYKQLLDLQESRVLFDLVTGKRTYNNMLIISIDNTTDRTNENSLMLSLLMQQQIIVQTVAVALAPTAAQAAPDLTGALQNAGTKQPIKAKAQSALSVLFGG